MCILLMFFRLIIYIMLIFIFNLGLKGLGISFFTSILWKHFYSYKAGQLNFVQRKSKQEQWSSLSKTFRIANSKILFGFHSYQSYYKRKLRILFVLLSNGMLFSACRKIIYELAIKVVQSHNCTVQTEVVHSRSTMRFPSLGSEATTCLTPTPMCPWLM